jgi:hypothetical protein
MDSIWLKGDDTVQIKALKTLASNICALNKSVLTVKIVFFLGYDGVSCTYCRYEKAVIAMAKQSVTLEVLSYHASASLEDAQRLRVSCVQANNKAKLKKSKIIICL